MTELDTGIMSQAQKPPEVEVRRADLADAGLVGRLAERDWQLGRSRLKVFRLQL